jgi:glycosyltransferase involved in cell wall biosynthesis
MISIIIPARNEPYLQKTIDDLFLKAAGDIEVVAVLDGYWPDPPLKSYRRLKIIHRGTARGMRAGINAGARIAQGKYLMKCDAHCCFDPGFDEKLKADCEPDWTVVPRRYGLNVETWNRTDKLYEFEYIEKGTLKGRKWPEYADRVKDQEIVDLMTSQGSCWFTHLDRFWELGGLDEINYGIMGREAQETCLKTWLSGGRYVLNRKTWYAHWSKPKKHVIKNPEKSKSVAAIQAEFPEEKLLPLIERFAPVPGWGSEVQKKVQGSKVKKHSTLNPEPGTRNPEEYIEKNYELNENKITGMTRAGLYRLFAELGYKTGCEVGVQRGRNAWIMFQNIPGLNLFLVEPYKDHPSNYRKWGEKIHAKFKKQAHERFNGYNVRWLEGFSEEVSGQVPDNSLDFAYIDGEHTYDFVMIDLILWSRKVKPGGIVSGHDYEYWKPNQPKVARAINDYADAYGINPIFMTDKKVNENPGDKFTSWFWIKT